MSTTKDAPSESREFAPGGIPGALTALFVGTTLVAAIGLVAAGARPNVWIPAVLLTLAVMAWALWPSGTLALEERGVTKRTPLGRPRFVPWDGIVRVSTSAEWDWPITYVQFRTQGKALAKWSFAYPGRPWSRQVQAHDSVRLLFALADSPAGEFFDSRSEALEQVLRAAVADATEASHGVAGSGNHGPAYRALLNGRHYKALSLLRQASLSASCVHDDLVKLEYVLTGACIDTCKQALADNPDNRLALYYLAMSYARPAVASLSSTLGNPDRLSDDRRREMMLEARQLFEELLSSPDYNAVASGWIGLLDEKIQRAKTG